MNKTRKTILGLILGLFLAFGGVFSFKAIAVTPIISLDDILEGSVITWNNSLTIPSSLNGGEIYERHGDYIISCNNTFYSSITFEYTNGNTYLNYDNTMVYSSINGWTSDVYKEIKTTAELTFTINGDTDNANSTIVSFMNNNASVNYTPSHSDYFTLTLMANGGEFIAIGSGNIYTTITASSSYGDSSAVLANLPQSYDFYKESYNFIGWNTNSNATNAMSASALDELSDDTTLYAIWRLASSVLVDFDSNAPLGTSIESGTTPASQYILSGTNYNLPGNTGHLSITGYNFIGWNTNASATTALTNYVVSSNTTFYAVWRQTPPSPTYKTLSFNDNGADSGTTPANQTVLTGSVINLPGNTGNLVKDGYVFVGWNTNASATTGLTSVRLDNNLIVYAIWVQRPSSYMNLSISINGNSVATYNMNKQDELANYVWWFTGMNNGLFELHFRDINYLEKISENTNYILYRGNTSLTFAFNGENVEKMEIYVNGDLADYGDTEELKEADGRWFNYVWYDGLTLLINIELEDDINTPLMSFRNIVKTIFDSTQILLDLKFGWISLGGIIAIVLGVGVAFFIFKVVRGGS